MLEVLAPHGALIVSCLNKTVEAKLPVSVLRAVVQAGETEQVD